MNWIVWVIGLWFGLVCVSALIARLREQVAPDGKPRELVDAELLFAEQTFRIDAPLALSARVDRAYLLRDLVILVELKTRAAPIAYRSDVIELSAQRIAVMYATGQPVADFAYVVIRSPQSGTQVMRRVMLLSEADIVALARRRERILVGAAAPCVTASTGICRKCPFRADCRPDL
ncbi:PD-(D/E)XK nuclease family protein [Massilia sp. TS11]|uniref:PD-(D/E)XK nuclease family protein n=1 Tax=Massilia sp. TS11 TaxID=2908003 RepID=UPI001EDAD86F|nr:PD-(D/E)XK nuclease family protein [Massilia sp. TS11]MCG2583874.1 PD-(D/E)XK nuclease family protein [Massilia sp. TS11]